MREDERSANAMMGTERFCCDGLCNKYQGRGGCPRRPETMPKARAKPRLHWLGFALAFVVVAVVMALMFGVAR